MSTLLSVTEDEVSSRIRSLLLAPGNIATILYHGWSDAFNILHSNTTLRPQLLSGLGNRAGELFLLNSTLTTFMLTQLSGARNDIANLIYEKLNSLPNFIFNPDGTVFEVQVNLPTASTITYGSVLGSSNLINGSATIPGTFVFTDPDIVPSGIGAFYTTVDFIPTDLQNFKTISYTLSVNIDPANLPPVTFIPPASLEYDENPKIFTIEINGPKQITITYTGRLSTTHINQLPPILPGDYTVTVSSLDTNYIGTSSYDFTITPSSIIPTPIPIST